jgi:hypothetical protein
MELDQECQVLLVGTLQEHEHNVKILEKCKIFWIRAKLPEEAYSLLSDGVIAISIARSAWGALPKDRHREFLNHICGFSSFAFVKADTIGFVDPPAFDHICAMARDTVPGQSQVAHGDSSNIADSDLPRLKAAAHALGGRDGVRLFPMDIPPTAARLLIAAVGSEIDDRNFPNVVELQTIGTKTMQGGNSQALLVQAHPDDGGRPLVIKYAPLDQLRDEMRRFSSFIKPWDQMLNPRLHYHDKEGVITFGIVDDPECPGAPAPTLESHLEKCFRKESGNPEPSLNVSELVGLIDRVVQKLIDLNSRRCSVTTHTSMAWMTLEPIDEALSRELKWTFPGIQSGSEPLLLAREAIDKLTPYSARAVVHGDLHLRNILVRDRREPFLIDYAYSGPGHPCFDLAWFESAVFFRFFRTLGGEQSISRLFSSLLEPGATFDLIVENHPGECTPDTNRVAIHTSVLCRNAAENVLRQHGVPPSQFRLMKLLVACQSLIRFDVQSIVVRAMITALVNSIENEA